MSDFYMIMPQPIVTHFLQKEKVTVLPYPSNSADLAPCEFFLFPKLKTFHAGRRYQSCQALGFAVYQYLTSMPASVAQLDAPSDWRPGGRGFNPRRGRQHSFVEIDREIFSTVILSLLLIQEGQLSVSGERMCTILVNRIED